LAEKRILQLGDPRLRVRCEAVAETATPAISQLIGDLHDTLTAFRSRTGHGRGIAAPQIGVLSRVIFVHMQPDGFCGPLINPEIVERSERSIVYWDDCFSFPDLLVRVRRPATVSVVYLDQAGCRQSLRADGGLSELLQHEIDHLDGILAVDRAIDRQSFMMRAEWERVGRPS
jgi:peptide deformylase